MLFTSYSFVVFFLAVFALYYILPKKFQWSLLLISSLFFYYVADYRYLFFMGITAVSSYLSALKLDKLNVTQKEYLSLHKEDMTKEEKKSYKESVKKKKRAWLLVAIIINIGILCMTKYTNFVISNINNFLSEAKALRMVDLIIPMGISFYTFQTVSYVTDVYRGTQKAQRNFFKLCLFVSFFPQLVQGPISRYKDLSETLYTEHKFEWKNVSFGFSRILWGYFKKVVLADRVVTGVTALIGNTDEYTGAYVFAAMLFYAFDIYCDFTGGIDITIGIAQILGIKVTENFNLPFFSKNIKEFWNRWHITMGTWFADYIFYPVSVSAPMLKLSKWSRKHLGQTIGKRTTVYLSCFIVWFTTGLWHGAAYNFIMWGIANFVVIMISQECEPLYAKFHKKCPWYKSTPYSVFQIVRTILLMGCLRMFDCYRDVPMTFKMLGTMFTKFNYEILFNGSLLKIGLTGADYLILFAGLIIVLSVSIIKVRVGSVREYIYQKNEAWLYAGSAALLVLILVFGAYGIGYDSSQFIYNQF